MTKSADQPSTDPSEHLLNAISTRSTAAIDEAAVATKGTSPSPFLEGTKLQYAWDSTSLGLLKTCPRLYQFTMIEGWTLGRDSGSVHLRFGIEYHQALQEYDVSRANGVRHEDAIHDVISALARRTANWPYSDETKAGRYKNRYTIIGLVIDYLDHFRNDPAKTYLRADGSPAVELSFRFSLDFGPVSQRVDADDPASGPSYLLCGHLDRVVSLNGSLLVLDHKTTTSTLDSGFFDQWEPSNQMTLYTLAGQTILDAPIKGVMISGAQILLEAPHRFVRGFTYRTPDQIAEWLDDLQTLFSINEHYATQNYWPMNDTSCDKFGGCKFRGICSKSPEARAKFLRADFRQQSVDERWNPLRAR